MKDTDPVLRLEVKHGKTTAVLKNQLPQPTAANNSALEDRSSDETSKPDQSNLAWKDDARPLRPIEQRKKVVHADVEDEEEDEDEDDDHGSTSKIDRQS